MSSEKRLKAAHAKYMREERERKFKCNFTAANAAKNSIKVHDTGDTGEKAQRKRPRIAKRIRS